MSWLTSNWDKLISVSLSVIVGGVVGFFSSLLMINDRINILNEKIGSIETKTTVTQNTLDKAALPHISKIEDLSNKIHLLEIKYTALQTQSTMIMSQSETLLQMRIGESRERLR